MLLSFCYDKADVIRALRHHFLNKPEIRIFAIILLILLVFASGGRLTGLVTTPALAGVVIMLAILLLAFWWLLPLSIYNKAATFRDSIKLRFNEDGIFIGTSSGERLVLWKNFHRFARTDQFIFLYRNNQSFFMIPLKAFQNSGDLEDFTRMLRSKVS